MPTFPRSSLSFRTAGFPQYGWKAGFSGESSQIVSGLSLLPAYAVQTFGLHPPFVHLVVTTVVPHCVGPKTRLRAAVEGHYSSAPGALAQVRVIVSRSVIT
jgi:hypothetical protein